MLSLAIDRTSLSLATLTISDSPAGAMWLPEDGIGRPAKTRRNAYATPGRFMHGQILSASTLEHSALPVQVYCRAASSAALRVLEDELEAALGQFTYTSVLTVDGVDDTWRCDPADIAWGLVDSGMVRGKISRASVVIPVFPIPEA